MPSDRIEPIRAAEDLLRPSSPEAEAWSRAVRSVGLDELVSAQPDWRLQYDQLSKGRFAGSLQHVRLPGMRLVLETATRAVRQRGQIGPRDIGFALGLSSAGVGYFHGQRLDGDSIMIGRGDDLDLTTPDDYVLIAIVVNRELLSEVWQRLYQKPWSTWLDEKVVVQARPGMAEHLRNSQMRILSSIESSPTLLNHRQVTLQMRDSLLIEWLEAIPERVDTSELRNIQSRQRVVDRACELVLGHPDKPPNLLDLCSQLGASPRKLDYCFRDVLGMSPSKYLRAIRLNGAQRELRSATDSSLSIHDIAARWGFWHMGGFSSDYKTQFGELPSDTLRNARLNGQGF